MRGGLTVLGACLLGVLVTVTAPVAAQTTSPEDDEARALFEAGSVAYGQGQFERALEYFQSAHRLSGRPQMLFNLGTTHDRLGDREAAVDHLRRYLEAVPEAPNRAFVERLLQELDGELSTAPSRPAPTAEVAVPIPPIVFMAVGGAMLLATAGTGFWWLDRNEAVDACNLVVGCSNGAQLADERDVAAGLTIALGAVAVGAFAVGLVWFVVADNEAQPSVACAPAWGSVHCSGRF